MSKKSLIFLLTAVIFLFSIFFLLKDVIKKDAASDIAYKIDGQPIFSTEYWSKKIKKLGIHEAYAVLAEVVANMDDYSQHLNAHQFGDALFKIKNLEGVVVCDSRFGNGCFHQFFITGLYKEGPNIAIKFEKACIDKLGIDNKTPACIHGIGHGIMASFSWKDISKALNICGAFQRQTSFFSCIDGVFMEYFTPTALVAKGKVATMKEVNWEKPDSVCLTIDSKFQPSCYSMAVSWWLRGGMSSKKAGEWCGKVDKPTNYEACFKGLGYVLVLSSKYDKDLVIKKCEEAVNNMYERVLCRAGAFWGFSKGEEVGEKLTKEDKALCDFQEKKWCLKESHLSDKGLGISTICCPNLQSL